MRILFVGDIVGRAGRAALSQHLETIRQARQIDFTIVNVENAAGGFGITPALARWALGLGVDVMTSGNHIWDKKEILPYLDAEPRLLRPGNYPPGLPGRGECLVESAAGVPVAVVNLQGRVFMPPIDCPFQMASRDVPRLASQAKVIVVDFHAEATSEKVAMGWHLDGKVSAIVGTHTHIPTADARILPGGSAYVTDVGMTGSYESVIGMQTEGALSRFLTALPARLEVATESPRFSAVAMDVDETTGKARSILRVDA